MFPAFYFRSVPSLTSHRPIFQPPPPPPLLFFSITKGLTYFYAVWAIKMTGQQSFWMIIDHYNPLHYENLSPFDISSEQMTSLGVVWWHQKSQSVWLKGTGNLGLHSQRWHGTRFGEGSKMEDRFLLNVNFFWFVSREIIIIAYKGVNFVILVIVKMRSREYFNSRKLYNRGWGLLAHPAPY